MQESNGRLDWNAFYQLSEIYTAPLNVIWFIFAAAIAYESYRYVNVVNVVLCCLTVFLFDLAVNIADNYFDYRNGKDEHFLQVSNPIGRLHLPVKQVGWLTAAMYLISAVPGLALVARTGWPVLLAGAIGYVIGIFYTAGPWPLNAMPLCELVVSVFISQFIVLVGVDVAIYGVHPFTVTTLWLTILRCLPLTLPFFAIQLANNTCDLREDLVNGRHTLASYLGTAWAMTVIKALMVSGLVLPLVLALGRVIPWPVALVVLLAPKTWHQTYPFFAKPDKQKTYLLIVKAGSLYITTYILLYAAVMLVTNLMGNH